MLLKRLRLDNFRNYSREELLPDPEVNLIYGANAQGKSNLLEAVSYLGMASSFRSALDQELIRYEQDYFYLESEGESETQGQLRISAAYSREKKRKWTVNGQPKKRLTDVVGLFHSVVFAPEDIYLVKAGPEHRRRYLNRQMSQNEREYCRLLLSYNHVLKQRNACLKKAGGNQVPEELAAWDRQLTAYGSAVIAGRQRTVAQLIPLAAELHSRLSGGETLALVYQDQLLAKAAGALDKEELAAVFGQELARLRQAELARGLTLIGPHRDDLLVLLNDRPARDYASQGQQRTLALALKLAELELARVLTGEYPLLLLDDVLSELDEDRRRQIISLVSGKTQTFISAVDGACPVRADAKWEVRNGEIFRD